jgi:hypothetical protein
MFHLSLRTAYKDFALLMVPIVQLRDRHYITKTGILLAFWSKLKEPSANGRVLYLVHMGENYSS